MTGLGVPVWRSPPGLLPGGAVARDKRRGAPRAGLSCAATRGDSATSKQTRWPAWSGRGSPGRRALRGLHVGPTGEAPGLKASGSAAGTAHRHQQAPAQVVGKQEAGPFALSPYPGHPLCYPLCYREEACGKCGSRRDRVCSNL